MMDTGETCTGMDTGAMPTSPPDLGAYPLRLGETLSSHDWVELHIHRLLTSRFLAYAVAEDRRADIGTALILWSEAFRQDPAGTLPDDDVQLAALARFGGDLDGWRAARAGALYGWLPVIVEGEERGGAVRLGHRMIMEIAARMVRRKSSRDQGRKAARLSVQKSRLREKVLKAGFKALAAQDDPLDRMLDWLNLGNLNISDDNVRAAMDHIGVPRVIRGRFREGGDDA